MYVAGLRLQPSDTEVPLLTEQGYIQALLIIDLEFPFLRPTDHIGIKFFPF